MVNLKEQYECSFFYKKLLFTNQYYKWYNYDEVFKLPISRYKILNMVKTKLIDKILM